MPDPAKPNTDWSTQSRFVVGRQRFARISAVEGIAPSAAMVKRSDEFDQRGLSAAERRQEIIDIHRGP